MEEEKSEEIGGEIGENSPEDDLKEITVEEQIEKKPEESKVEKEVTIGAIEKPIEEKEKKKLTFKEKTISFFKNKYNLAFLVILFLAFLIRLKYIGQESLWNDAAVHLWQAIKIVKEPVFFFSQDFLTSQHLPIKLMTAFFYLIGFKPFIAGKIVAILFGLTGIIFMYLLGTELKSRFVGLISAALLGFHHLFWFYGVRLLADGPLVTMMVIILYFFVKLEKEKKVKWGIWFGISVLTGIVLKQQLIILPIFLVIYYLIHKRKEMFKNKAILYSWLIAVALPFLGGAVLTFMGNKVFVSLFFGKLFALRGMTTGFDSTAHFPHLFSWYLIILMVIGFLLILLYKEKKYYFMAYFFMLYWWWFEIGNRATEDRYLLPLLPVAIIFGVMALDEMGNYLRIFFKSKYAKYAKYTLIVILVVFLCWNFYSKGDDMIYYKSTSYVGHIEAGEWLKENVPEGIPIFVGSPRMERPFIEREYGGPGKWDKGGSLWYLRNDEYLKNQSLFEEDLVTLSKKSEVYLEIDIWEYTQPKWYFPINQESLNYFTSLGFQIVKVVEREIPTQQGLQKMPVIFLFKKEQVEDSEEN